MAVAETFRNCLGIIYTVHAENLGLPLETLIGNVLGCVFVPPPGGPQIRFSIGVGDRQCLQVRHRFFFVSFFFFIICGFSALHFPAFH